MFLQKRPERSPTESLWFASESVCSKQWHLLWLRSSVSFWQDNQGFINIANFDAAQGNQERSLLKKASVKFIQ
jgi:hypothetical protein